LVAERVYWLAWSQVPGISTALLQKIAAHCGNIQEAWYADLAALQTVAGIKNNQLTAIAQTRSEIEPEVFFREHSRLNPHFWTISDTEYPQLLLESPIAPPVIYYRGEVKFEENQGVTPVMAIVGTRQGTDHGYRWAAKLSSYLAKYGLAIAAGMAPGIETVVHRACLEVGGRTIAVLGTGVDVVYPQKQSQLYQEILSHGGLILSEYPRGTTAERNHFPARNRLIAALCRGVIVIEASETSGCLITARYANELGRDVYALPNSPDIPQARGCLHLLNQGANPIIDEQDLLIDLGTIPQLDVNPTTPDLSTELTLVLQAVKSEPTSFEAIIQTTNLDSGTVAGSLLELELLGLVSQLPGMRYSRS